ncbi:Transketolase-like protein 1 [Myotis davidii]|uniref:Transketolase-like protein 1 n=1 Tax=Myotis davidii TaxID=225400 RepID=L5M371_MYODS|nr:Transketolase-like protein 1 [Myotis davidii]
MHRWPDITIGDHHPEGGFEEVCSTASMEPGILVHGLAVQGVPPSGKSSELLGMFGISAKHIIVAMKCMLTN